MAKRLLATVTTDNKGKATYTLTGSAKGKLQLQAEIVDGELTSPILTIYDSIVKDIGVKGKNNPSAWEDYLLNHDIFKKSVNIKVNNEYTSISPIDRYARLLLKTELPRHCYIECDVYINPTKLTDYFISLRETDKSIARNIHLNMAEIPKYTWTHLKLEIDSDNNNTVTINDNKTYTLQNKQAKYFYWQFTGGNINTIRFKNFCVYE